MNKSQYIISGTDFQNFTYNTITLEEASENEKEIAYQSNPNYEEKGTIQTILIKNKRKISISSELLTIDMKVDSNPSIDEIIHSWLHKLKQEFNKPLFVLHSDLETRSTFIRKNESQIGNFIVEIVRLYYGVDIAMINSGGIRTDCIIPSGPIALGVLKRMFPFDYSLSKILIFGQDLKILIDSALQDYPVLTGSFPSISGLQIEASYDSSKRLRVTQIKNISTGELIENDKQYSLITRKKLVHGLDKWNFDHIDPEKIEDLDNRAELIIIAMFEHLYEEGKILRLFDYEYQQKIGVAENDELEQFLRKITVKKVESENPFESYAIDINSVPINNLKIL